MDAVDPAVHGRMGTMTVGHWLIFLAYFAPWLVAWLRGVKPIAGIAIVNVFLGWTFVGWVGALAWAAIADKKAAVGAVDATP